MGHVACFGIFWIIQTMVVNCFRLAWLAICYWWITLPLVIVINLIEYSVTLSVQMGMHPMSLLKIIVGSLCLITAFVWHMWKPISHTWQRTPPSTAAVPASPKRLEYRQVSWEECQR
jgi:hypothetical protein